MLMNKCIMNLLNELRKNDKMQGFVELRHEKTNVMVSDRVRHKPGCTATEDG